MKLFVWNNPYEVRWGHSLVVAVAETVEDARQQAIAGKAYTYGQFERDGVQGTPLGEPIRIVDLPCAEWHEWSE
jgi:hypothetical protein